MEITEREKNMQLADRLWREYEPYIRKLCVYKLGSHKECIDDCVQDVFVALVEAIYKGTKIENPKAWLTSVANNVIKDNYKQSSNKPEVLPFEEKYVDKYSTGYKSTFEIDIDSYISQIIEHLTGYEKRLFVDFYLKNKKQSEMAKERGITERNVQQQVFRLKRKIIEFVGQLFD